MSRILLKVLPIGLTLSLVALAGGTQYGLDAPSAEACGMSWEGLRMELGYGGMMPKGAMGFHFRPHSYRSSTSFTGKDLRVVSNDKKARKVAFQVEETNEKGRYWLAFKQPLAVGQSVVVHYRESRSIVTMSSKSLDAPHLKELSLKVSTNARASIFAKATDSSFVPLFRYRFHLDGKKQVERSNASHYLNLCAGGDLRKGWHEVAVDVWPVDKPELSRFSSRDVWVDCELASKGKHPSITKGGDEHFTPSLAMVSIP